MPRRYKRQRTTSDLTNDGIPSTPAGSTTSAGTSKARLSTGDDAADLDALIAQITKCKAKMNGYPYFYAPDFCDPPEHDDDNVAYVLYKCKTPNCDYAAKRLVTAAPAAQLYSHARWCAMEEKGQLKLTDSPAFEGMGRLEGAEVLQVFALWCACNGRPFGITEDVKLHRLLDDVARRHRPSASTISTAVKDLADFCQEEVMRMLDRAFGGIYLAMDAWTAPNGVEVLGILAFFKTKTRAGEFADHVVPLSFTPLVDRHSGSYLADLVRHACDVYGIQEKVLGIASDNASNMGKMMEELEDYGIGRDKWTLFAYFDNTAKNKPADPRAPIDEEEPSLEERQQALEDEEDDEDEGEAYGEMEEESVDAVYAEARQTSERSPSSGGGAEDEEVERFLPKKEGAANLYTRSSTKWSINKAQRLAERCRYNSATRKALASLSAAALPPPPGPHSIYPAVKTRWNSRARQFRQIVNHRPQIEKIQNDPKFKFKKENKLTATDFELFEDLLTVLEPFEEMTLDFSTKGGGQIEDVIPMIDKLVRHLETFLSDSATVPALHNAIIGVLEKLFFYYGKTGDCPYYVAAILLHPALGVRYLRAQKWPQAWIDDAISDTQELYNTRHLRQAQIRRDWAQIKRAGTTTGRGGIKSTLELMDEEDNEEIDLSKIIYNFAVAKHTRVDSEGNPVIALDYWKRQYLAGEKREGLTMLALDIFGCPASSVDVERAFSFSGFTVSNRRHNLSAATITSCMFVAACDKHGIVKPGMLREGRQRRAEQKRKASEVISVGD
ncbi:hypothetical protein JCM5296_000211, partial [Sporobolomyces johnsonii]